MYWIHWTNWIYWIYSIYCVHWNHTSFEMNWLDSEKTKGGEFENLGFRSKSNYKVKFLLETWCSHPVCAVILHLALCWKHDLNNSLLRQTFKTKISWNIQTSNNVKFDIKIKNRLIFKYDLLSINTCWYILKYCLDYYSIFICK